MLMKVDVNRSFHFEFALFVNSDANGFPWGLVTPRATLQQAVRAMIDADVQVKADRLRFTTISAARHNIEVVIPPWSGVLRQVALYTSCNAIILGVQPPEGNIPQGIPEDGAHNHDQ
eukprot:CAMPEP_0172913680 /NCGR_PEP_ID=MMETSP1075-20121228/190890_1 /TAXON_ID=2916 /ORGANISM="Ceratium fusus, Strain PA161109" /LENGTH=116 /DNA_ID=CAMNT_0013772445 /DNA_START=791 /DNA_END=1139 /DNA_ORIENTATION=+